MDDNLIPTEEELDDDAFLASLDDLLKEDSEKEEAASPEKAPEETSKKEKKQLPKWLLPALCAGLACAVVAAGIYGILTLADPYHRKIVEGVSFGTVDLSNMTKGQAKKALNAVYKNPTMTVSFPDFGLPLEESGTMSLSSLSITPDGAGVYVDTAGALQAAYAVGRTEEAQDGTTIPFADFLTLDTEALRQNVADFEERLQSYTIPHTAYLEGVKPDVTDPKAVPQTLVITPARQGPKSTETPCTRTCWPLISRGTSAAPTPGLLPKAPRN